MKLESGALERGEKNREVKAEGRLAQVFEVLKKELEKITEGPGKKIAMLIAALGVMGTAELSAQNRENLDSLVRVTRETVASLDSAVRAGSGRRGEMTINGHRTEFFEQTVSNQEIHTNDFWIHIIDRSEGGTVFTIDIGKNGVPDQIVTVPGSVNNAEKAFIVNGLIDNSARRIATEASMSDMQRNFGDRPALHRVVNVLDQATHKWQVINFEDASVRESPNQTLPQNYWSAASARAMETLRQGIR